MINIKGKKLTAYRNATYTPDKVVLGVRIWLARRWADGKNIKFVPDWQWSEGQSS